MILGFSHPQDQYVPTFLTGWLDQSLRESLLTTPGVGDVVVFGGSELSFRIWLDPQRLEQAHLTVTDVTQALAEQNVLAAIGSIGASPAPSGQLISLPVEAEGRLRSQDEFEISSCVNSITEDSSGSKMWAGWCLDRKAMAAAP